MGSIDVAAAHAAERAAMWTRRVPIANIRTLADPTVEWVWISIPPAMPLTIEHVTLFDPTEEPFDDDSPFNTGLHLGRIRWLIEHGWDDPIEIDVGCPGLGYDGPPWPIIDGNHRLTAAILRGDTHIDMIASGDLDHANHLLQPDRPW